MVSGSFSLLCSRFFSPFLHSTGSLSVSREYLALRDGPRGFIQDFSCPALLRILLHILRVSSTGLSPSAADLSRSFDYALFDAFCSPSTPFMPKHDRFGLFRFRSPLLTESLLFSFPVGNEMFQFPTFAHGLSPCVVVKRRVAPFGDLRVSGYLLLPAAFRSLSRPSSPPRA